MSELNQELHAEFFTRWSNEASLAISDMDELQMTEWRNEMAKIALEAKVKTSYADAKLREKKAEKIKAGKPWLVPSSSEIDESGIKTRKERMSKEAKTLELLKSLGVDDADSIMAQIANKKNSSLTSSTERVIIEKVEVVHQTPKSTNTQESLLNDISDSIISGIKDDRPIDDLTAASVTAGHIANKLLNAQPESSVSLVSDTNDELDFSKMFN